ncbi:SpoIID/LytB domain-containing protein [Angustibacter sp. McL0619]|uniref:SpoIID/LytB domain-containing protein n=1 Tax=Angustibacter sp. McL0619 TaxID=3415676 RepID=UPI003CE7AAD6
MRRSSDIRVNAPRRGRSIAAGVLVLGLLVPVQAVLSAVPASAATCPAPGTGSISNAPDPSGVDWVVRGHGFGHSVGMSQYGAQGAASLGCTYREILAAYYPGTTVLTRTLATKVDVKLMRGGSKVLLTAVSLDIPWYGPDGKTATQPKGSTWSVVLSGTSQFVRDAADHNVFSAAAGQTVRAYQNGRIVRVRSYDGTSLVTDRTMRWDETQFLTSSAGLDSTQALRTSSAGDAVQKYLWGLAEVPSSWPQQALYAQATAARTYLVRRYVAATGAYTVWATTQDQNYQGYTHESDDAAAGGHWRTAVDNVPGRIIMYGSSVIDAMYTSSHGGHSEDVRYSFGGTTKIPYLVSVDDSQWDLASSNPLRAWTVGYSNASFASRFGMDSVTSVSLANPATEARLSGVTVTGKKSGATVTKNYTGMAARSLLGVRSPGFTIVRKTPLPPASNGIAISGDWDGNGVDDVGWFKDGVFSLRWPDGTTRRIELGQAGDIPVVADWDGDSEHRDGIGVFRNGVWQTRNSLSGAGVVTTFTYGQAGDLPIAGHWTAAAAANIGVVRAGVWRMRPTATAGEPTLIAPFPGSGKPMLGDWDGNGMDTPGWFGNGVWHLSNLITHPAVHRTVTFGRAGDQPVPGDWDGNHSTTTGIARSSSFFWRNDLLGGAATGSRVYGP